MRPTATWRLTGRTRALVAAGALIATLTGTLLVYSVSLGLPPSVERRPHNRGVASAQLLVDSKSSQAADIGQTPEIIDIQGLVGRARLLANLIATSPLRDRVARRARIDPQTFLATAPSIVFDAAGPTTRTPEAPIVMDVTFNESLPIVIVNVEAPDEATAARVASAAAPEVNTYLSSLVVQDQVPDAYQLEVQPLGSAKSTTVPDGLQPPTALLVSLFVFALWCASIVAASRLQRGWREAGRLAEAEALPERPDRARGGFSA